MKVLTVHGNAHDQKGEDPGINDEKEVVVVVVGSHTIVNPGAVMVESLDTNIAHRAMARPGCPNDFAVRAQFIGVKLIHQFLKV